MVVSTSYPTLFAIAAVLLSILFEWQPAFKSWWDLSFGPRTKPLAMAVIVSAVGAVLYSLGCYLPTIASYITFDPPFVCGPGRLLSWLTTIGFGFGTQQLFYAFVKYVIDRFNGTPDTPAFGGPGLEERLHSAAASRYDEPRERQLPLDIEFKVEKPLKRSKK